VQGSFTGEGKVNVQNLEQSTEFPKIFLVLKGKWRNPDPSGEAPCELFVAMLAVLSPRT